MALLTAVDGAWRVERGSVDVFGVRLRDGRPVGRRVPLVRIPASDVVFSVPKIEETDLQTARASVGLLAVGTSDASWTPVLASEATTDDVQRWATSLLSALGDADEESKTQDGPPIPTATEGIDWACFHADVLKRTASCIEAQRTAERDRARASQTYRTDVFETALHRLGSVFPTADAASETASSEAARVTSPTPGGEADPLWDTLQVVAASLGTSLVQPGEAVQKRRDRVRWIAEASGLQTRTVVLKGTWWTDEHGPLLARWSDCGTPVALLPRRRWGRLVYEAVSPSGSVVRVDADTAAQLHPFATSFYRTLPPRALDWTDLVRFASRGTGRDLWVVGLLAAGTGLLSAVPPVATSVLVQDVLPSGDRGQLWVLLMALLVTAVSIGAFRLTQGIALLRIQTRVRTTVQAALWDRLLALPTSFFRDYAAGDLARRMAAFSRTYGLFGGTAVTACLSAVFSVVNVGLMIYYGGMLAAWALGGLALLFGALLAGQAMQLRDQRAVAKLDARLSGFVLQLLTGIGKLRTAYAEAFAFAEWTAPFARKRTRQYRQRRTENGVLMLRRLAPLLINLGVFALALPHIQNGTLMLGDFLGFTAALTIVLTSMLAVHPALAQLAGVIPHYEQARPVLQSVPETRVGSHDPGRLSGQLSVTHVRFRYADDGPWVLRDVSLEVNPGELVALVGSSGSGKSTLLRLLLGFNTPQHGTVAYDGRGLHELDLQAVRAQMGVVLQDGGLLPGDIQANIVGSTLASRDRAWEAARLAGLADDIQAMPMGMHTVLSEGGATLSGGQRQRLMIARALVKRPRLLFLDEATSALDNRTQAQVRESLDGLAVTRVVIAHRLSTIRNADRIFVLDQGRLVQSGTYDELRDVPGAFRELAARQEV